MCVQVCVHMCVSHTSTEWFGLVCIQLPYPDYLSVSVAFSPLSLRFPPCLSLCLSLSLIRLVRVQSVMSVSMFKEWTFFTGYMFKEHVCVGGGGASVRHKCT